MKICQRGRKDEMDVLTHVCECVSEDVSGASLEQVDHACIHVSVSAYTWV